ncbi:hypothetical protein LUZ63_007519 [Rhynchospora breviuscula]|uniref:Reverse transcriptase zinc-binding domain-containing protein n=1 Tax=Rhynchospora breviuscula TaxID=2022672 RepID=A0A9Q0CSP4_9POAL|nr:hypothetical protein LUZ63_007519 [Rhynchospora breviuscula]
MHLNALRRFSVAYFTLDTSLTLSQFVTKWRNNERLFRDSLRTSNSASMQWSLLSQSLSTFNLSQNMDHFIWSTNSDGNFSVKSIYNFQKTYPKITSTLFPLWKLNIPPRMRIFLWQMAQNKISTIDNLKKRGWQLANVCTLCASEEETVQHLFNDCPFFIEAMQTTSLHSADLSTLAFTSNPNFLTQVSAPKTHREIMGILCFVVWRERTIRPYRLRPRAFSFEIIISFILSFRRTKFLRRVHTSSSSHK